MMLKRWFLFHLRSITVYLKRHVKTNDIIQPTDLSNDYPTRGEKKMEMEVLPTHDEEKIHGTESQKDNIEMSKNDTDNFKNNNRNKDIEMTGYGDGNDEKLQPPPGIPSKKKVRKEKVVFKKKKRKKAWLRYS